MKTSTILAIAALCVSSAYAAEDKGSTSTELQILEEKFGNLAENDVQPNDMADYKKYVGLKNAAEAEAHRNLIASFDNMTKDQVAELSPEDKSLYDKHMKNKNEETERNAKEEGKSKTVPKPNPTDSKPAPVKGGADTGVVPPPKDTGVVPPPKETGGKGAGALPPNTQPQQPPPSAPVTKEAVAEKLKTAKKLDGLTKEELGMAVITRELVEASSAPEKDSKKFHFCDLYDEEKMKELKKSDEPLHDALKAKCAKDDGAASTMRVGAASVALAIAASFLF